MSRYFAGTIKLDENTLSEIEENVKVNIYNKISELGFVSEWEVSYGFDHACMYFIQFNKVTIDDFEGKQTIDIDYIFDGLNGKETGYLLEKFFPERIMVISHANMAYADCGF